MFESTLSAQGLSDTERKLGPLSFAVIGHVAVISMIVGVTAILIPPVQVPEPAVTHVFVLRPPDVDLGPQSSGSRQPKKATDNSRPGRSVVPHPPVPSPAPPVTTPDTLPTTGDASSPDGPEGPDDGTVGGPDGSGSDIFGEGGGDGGGPVGDGTGPVPVSAEMVKPALLVKVAPDYPDVARIARLPGRVIVQAVIGLDGSVESAEILSSTNPLFNDAARNAVLRWRYRPAQMNGLPIRVYFTVVVEFSIR